MISPLFGTSRPTTPPWPVNQRSPSWSKVAVFRFAFAVPAGSANTRSVRSGQPTRTIAPSPPSVIHAAWSGPWITPCGAEPVPSGINSTRAVFGSNQPSSPLRCALNQTPPSGAGATSWMPVAFAVFSGHDCIVAPPSLASTGIDGAIRPAASAASALRREIAGIGASFG